MPVSWPITAWLRRMFRSRALALAVTVEDLAYQYLLCLQFGEPPILSDAQMGDVFEKFKTNGQQSPAVLEGLRQAS